MRMRRRCPSEHTAAQQCWQQLCRVSTTEQANRFFFNFPQVVCISVRSVSLLDCVARLHFCAHSAALFWWPQPYRMSGSLVQGVQPCCAECTTSNTFLLSVREFECECSLVPPMLIVPRRGDYVPSTRPSPNPPSFLAFSSSCKNVSADQHPCEQSHARCRAKPLPLLPNSPVSVQLSLSTLLPTLCSLVCWYWLGRPCARRTGAGSMDPKPSCHYPSCTLVCTCLLVAGRPCAKWCGHDGSKTLMSPSILYPCVQMCLPVT